MHATKSHRTPEIDVAIDFRQQIKDKLKQLNMTAYGLSNLMGGTPSKNQLYTYLRGKTDMTGEYISQVLEALELEENRQGKKR